MDSVMPSFFMDDLVTMHQAPGAFWGVLYFLVLSLVLLIQSLYTLSNISIFNPRSACATRVTILGLCVCLSVCLSVCLRLFSHYMLRGGLRAIPTTSVLQGNEKYCGDFAETTAFERYGVKTSVKANMHNEHWLTLNRFGVMHCIVLFTFNHNVL